MIGESLSQILLEIEEIIIENEVDLGVKLNYNKEAIRSATIIFMSVITEKMWELQKLENIDIEDRGNMSIKCGEELRAFVKKFTDIDTHELYK
jgi:hypothetical protein